jgi:hypothetical protein
LSLGAAVPSEAPAAGGELGVLRYLDVVLLVVAAPIMILIGVDAAGYAVGAGAWIALRVVGIGVERLAAETSEPGRQIGIRLGYMLGRLFVLAIAVVLVRKGSGQDAGLTALVVIVFAFTVQLALSAINCPRRS